MPTPDLSDPPLGRASSHPWIPGHATCPPEDDRPEVLVNGTTASRDTRGMDPVSRTDALSPPSTEAHPSAAVPGPSTSPSSADSASSASLRTANTSPVPRDTPSPNTVVDLSSKSGRPNAIPRTTSPPSNLCFSPQLQGNETPTAQPMPQHTSSFLRHGSKFVGTQQSDSQVYNVSVEIKYVDMAESFICGYLRIEGLTRDLPTMTTYFEGEVIGAKYTFQTRHADWGSNTKVDMQHWNRFPAWRPLSRQAAQPDFTYKNYVDREHLFMRWKEHFLVPDHHVRSISGASFEGFYYICFSQKTGNVAGIYFHSKSEKFQQLDLKHVHDYGSKGALEFA